mmetsp:Transcript_1669/g.5185  ORF Transcript_1669/g.5185 Transcript_1669/m.5185 type:complete len:291 (-) Transcript_1669:943-1815(-)
MREWGALGGGAPLASTGGRPPAGSALALPPHVGLLAGGRGQHLAAEPQLEATAADGGDAGALLLLAALMLGLLQGYVALARLAAARQEALLHAAVRTLAVLVRVGEVPVQQLLHRHAAVVYAFPVRAKVGSEFLVHGLGQDPLAAVANTPLRDVEAKEPQEDLQGPPLAEAVRVARGDVRGVIFTVGGRIAQHGQDAPGRAGRRAGRGKAVLPEESRRLRSCVPVVGNGGIGRVEVVAVGPHPRSHAELLPRKHHVQAAVVGHPEDPVPAREGDARAPERRQDRRLSHLW